MQAPIPGAIRITGAQHEGAPIGLKQHPPQP